MPHHTSRYSTVLTGVAIGAGLMWLLDPASGGRRRALARDKARRLGRDAADAARSTARDLSNRAAGVRARIDALRSPEATPSNDILVERVRAELGRFSSHPRAIDVLAADGVVCLQGPVLAGEADRLVKAIWRVRGVESVEDELERHDTADVPALQGGAPRPGRLSAFTQARWSPTTRLLAGLCAATTAIAVGKLVTATRHITDTEDFYEFPVLP